MPLEAWLTRNSKYLYRIGVIDGIDIYLPLERPWMEDEMKDNDPNKPCGCQPIIPANPCCEGGDDDEED